MTFFRLFIPLLIAVFLILFDYKFSHLTQLRQTFATVFSPIYAVVNFPSQLYTWINQQGLSVDNLRQDNDNLRNELFELHVKLQQNQALSLENKKLKQLLESSYNLSRKMTTAKVVSVSQSRLKKQIVINKGSNDGLKIGQVALGAKGVVGQITQIMPGYATLLLVSDPTQYVPVKNARNGIRGVSQGGVGKRHNLSVNFIEAALDVQVGDVFLSSDIGQKFPDGYPLGTVISVVKTKNKPFLQIQLRPAQSVQSLAFLMMLGAEK